MFGGLMGFLDFLGLQELKAAVVLHIALGIAWIDADDHHPF